MIIRLEKCAETILFVRFQYVSNGITFFLRRAQDTAGSTGNLAHDLRRTQQTVGAEHHPNPFVDICRRELLPHIRRSHVKLHQHLVTTGIFAFLNRNLFDVRAVNNRIARCVAVTNVELV